VSLKDGPSTLLNEQVATVEARAGHKANELFEQGTSTAWGWVNPARFIRWFTDGERRYGKTLETGQCLSQSRGDNPEYRRRKVWREGLEVVKIARDSGESRSRLSIPSRRLVRPVRFMPITIRPTTVPTDGRLAPTAGDKISMPNG